MRPNEIGIEIMWGVMRLFSRLPLGFHYFWAGCITWILKNVIHYRYDIVMINLSRAFPEKTYQEIRHIAGQFYRHLGDIMAEAVWFGGCDYERLRKASICRIANPEVLADAYEKSPGVTIMFSHCGNWEIVGGLLGYNDRDAVSWPFGPENIYVVYKRQRSHFWDELLKRNRMAPEPGYKGEVESSEILRFAIKNRNNKGIYIYPTDQFPYMSRHDIGRFMNQPTMAMNGGAGVAHKLGMSVLYMKMVHLERGRYEMTFEPICDDASDMTPDEITRKYFDLLEEEICQTPHNWLWSHKRWKK